MNLLQCRQYRALGFRGEYPPRALQLSAENSFPQWGQPAAEGQNFVGLGFIRSYPEREYRLIVKGSGEVQLNFGARGTFICPVDTLVEVTGAVSV